MTDLRPSRTGLRGPMLHRGRVPWVDLGLVAVTLILFAVAWPTLHVTHVVPVAMAPFVAGLAALPLLLVRVNPALGWAISAGGAYLIALAVSNQPSDDIPFQVVHILVLFVLLFAVGVTAPVPLLVVVWVATSLLFGATMPGSEDGPVWGWAIGFGALLLFAYLLRSLTSSRRLLLQQEEQNELERARRAILEEKAQIARDLHDVVAHHMSLVVVQAQTAPYRIEGLSDAAQSEFDSIGVAARTALDEIRTLLGVLRSDGQLPEHTPQPVAGDVVGLCEGAIRAGTPLTYTVSGDLDRVGDSSGLALYRILQESLANVSRHAPGAAVRVEIVCDHELRAEIGNGPAVAPPAGTAGGHGIPGMRTRAAAAGGELTAGPRADGGFRVFARLPLNATAAGPELPADAIG